MIQNNQPFDRTQKIWAWVVGTIITLATIAWFGSMILAMMGVSP